jgi:RimK family alpha-L-glutamate ligase
MAEGLKGFHPRVAIVGWEQQTNRELADELRERRVRADLLSPSQALVVLEEGDLAIGRLDVLPTLDGVEPGLDSLTELEARGVFVLNRAQALLAAHDKLRTAEHLQQAGLPRPWTIHIRSAGELFVPPLPAVVKPRFGSWGACVFRCETEEELDALLVDLQDTPWFARDGALLQEFIPNDGYDLRVIVAAGHVVGAAGRVAKPGEWRTNVSLGGTRRRVTPTPEASSLAVRAAQAIGADFVGVDLIPSAGGFVVLELNGAVEFDHAYDLPGSDVYCALIEALALPRPAPVLALL